MVPVGVFTQINYGQASFIGADAGQLNLDARIAGNFAMTKVGDGTLEFRGTIDNTSNGAVNVFGGTLNLNKTATQNTAILGALTIGDNDGGLDADKVVIVNYDQIGNAITVNVNRSGQLNTNVAVANETQTITFNAAPTGGTFTLTFAGQVTSSLAFNAPLTGALSVQEALENLNGVGVGQVAVTGSVGAYVVTFTGNLGTANLPQIYATSSLTNASGAVGITAATTTHGAGNEVQAIAIQGTGIQAGSNYSVTVNGATATVPVLTTGAAQALQNAIAGINNSETQAIAISGTGLVGSYTLNLAGRSTPPLAVASTAAQVQAAINLLTNGIGTEVQTVTFGGTGLSGTYTLTFQGVTTAPLTVGVDTAATVQAALQLSSHDQQRRARSQRPGQWHRHRGFRRHLHDLLPGPLGERRSAPDHRCRGHFHRHQPDPRHRNHVPRGRQRDSEPGLLWQYQLHSHVPRNFRGEH